MNNQKIELQRLIIFLLFAFALAWIPELVFFADNAYSLETGGTNFILGFSMLAPSFGVLITRWVTKEGFAPTGENSLMLGISFRDKKWIWWLFAAFLPWIYKELGGWLFIALKPEIFDATLPSELGISTAAVFILPLYSIINAIIYSFGGLGEELGWRGYMMPKLEKRMGIGPAVIVGGIIWGVWHYPATVYGHNFGTGYWGDPWLGCLIFTVFTIATNATFTLVTKKTGSVWSAAFMHAVNNGVLVICTYFMNADRLTGIWRESTLQFVIIFFPSLILGVISFVLLCKMPKKSDIF